MVLDVVGGGVLEVLMIVEEVELVVSEELVETGGGLLLAIELDDGIEVLEGDGDAWVDVVGTPVIVLVELVDIVNCLLKTSFLGRLDVAMSAKRNSIMVCCYHVFLGELHHTSSKDRPMQTMQPRLSRLGCLVVNA